MPAFFFFLVGCAASVSAEGIEGGFGLGLSAIVARAEVDEFALQFILVSNVPDLCARYQRYFESSHAMHRVESTVDDAGYCAEHEVVWREHFDARNALYFEGAHFVWLVAESYTEGQYTLESEAYGSLSAWTATPYASAMEGYHTQDDGHELCGRDEITSVEDDVLRWTLDEGTFEIVDSSDEGGALLGELRGRMLGQEQAALDGDFSADFAASRCDLLATVDLSNSED